MSCTENESGPFVVFFLPAVVGCLTILLARRWANSQVSNTSSTAVSRRRKIIKDPLVKRPLPPIACKMVAPGSKKASGVAKKTSTYPGVDDDINAVGKRTSRAPRHSPSAPGAPMPEIKAPEGPVGPKHIPFPYIPQDGEMLFEVMTCVFILVATGLQFLNLYRTVWWLPHSTTTQAMNFYLIDPHVVSFIVAVGCRRVLMCVSLSVLRTVTPQPSAYGLAALRMFVLGVFLGLVSWSTYFIFLKYSWDKLFFLFYPITIYLGLFGFQVSPFLELHNEDIPLHNCSQDTNHIKTEIANLRNDFNMRVKKILFNSIIEAYYSSFVPLAFAQPYLYYDIQAACQQIGLVWGALLGRYCSQLLSANYIDTPHRAAKHLYTHYCECEGAMCGPPRAPRAEWRVWLYGAGLTRAELQHARFHAVFYNPSMLLCLVLCLQLSLIVLQLCLLFSSIPWHNFLAIIILLFINYYTLFKMIRDYLVAWKVYKAEDMIQEKNYAVSNNYSTSN